MAQDQYNLIPKTNALVTKANALVESNYKLGLIEQKIILMLASKIQPSDTEFKTYTLSIKEFVKLLGISSKSKYEEVRQITMKLMKKAFEMRLENKVIQVSWLSYVAYNENEGTVDLRFDPFLKPYLLELKSHFTSYRLENVVKLKSSYSIRIYELLKQYEKLKERTFDLDHLRDILGVQDTYPVYGNFKQRVLKPAQKEMKKKTDLSFDIDEIKQGRKVVKVRFLIQRNKEKETDRGQQLSLFSNDQDQESIVEPLLNKHSLDVPPSLLERWMSFGEDRVFKALQVAIHKGNVKNKIGYVTTMLEKGYDQVENTSEPQQASDHQTLVHHIYNAEIRGRGLIPKWMIKNTVIDYLMKNEDYTSEEAHAFWEENDSAFIHSFERTL
ncbi:replication initiation protein [Alkalihalobacillus sp. TS-13]|uniref:replication initiation protein n=1 Tax=Alkalihalobacillus sp. TS-13 TaxID=2842455 RepID=UPI001C878F9F|nr:replication initiation protein [Alkalihalobacillus sp. TS-13]